MKNYTLASEKRLADLSTSLLQVFPRAKLGEITDEAGTPYSSMTLELSNGVRLSVCSDLDQPNTHLMVMHVTGTEKLPFEQVFEDGFGVSEGLTMQEAIELLKQYEGLDAITSTERRHVPAESYHYLT
jgi:hypothetical protein